MQLTQQVMWEMHLAMLQATKQSLGERDSEILFNELQARRNRGSAVDALTVLKAYLAKKAGQESQDPMIDEPAKLHAEITEQKVQGGIAGVSHATRSGKFGVDVDEKGALSNGHNNSGGSKSAHLQSSHMRAKCQTETSHSREQENAPPAQSLASQAAPGAMHVKYQHGEVRPTDALALRLQAIQHAQDAGDEGMTTSVIPV